MPELNENTKAAEQTNEILVPRALAGQSLTVDAGSANYKLPFDPAVAEVSRDGNDLTFTFDDGGSTTITNFFEFVEDAKSQLELPDGAEVAALSFLENYGIDPAPAAGPNASPGAPGSGSGAYRDDAGNLVDGVNRLGMTDPFFWGVTTEFTLREPIGVQPAGVFDLGVTPTPPVTPGGGFDMAKGEVYEDGLKDKHTNDYENFQAGQLNLTVTPDEGSTVGEVRISGLEGGTLYLGDPASGGTVIELGEEGVYHFEADQFTAPGIYFLPDQNQSDKDITFDIEVDFTADGGTVTVSGEGVIIVDAVADYTIVKDAGLVADESGHTLTSKDAVNQYNDGFYESTSELNTDSGKDTSAKVTLKVTGEFKDFDGSEDHFILIGTTVTDGNGDTVDITIDYNSLPPGYTLVGELYVDVDGDGNSKEYYKIQVDNEILKENGGSASLMVDANINGIGEDTRINWTVGTQSHEKVTDGEFDLNNNTSTTIGDSQAVTSIDVVNSELTVKVGWASEGNDASKHLSANDSQGNPYDPDFGAMDDGRGVSGQSTSDKGAPIDISISGEAGYPEFITEATLDFGGAEGTLSWDNAEGYSVECNADGTYTITIDPASGAKDLSELNLHYTPNSESYSDEDVNLKFEVTSKE